MYGIYKLYGRSRYIINYEMYIIYICMFCAHVQIAIIIKDKSEGKMPTKCKSVGNIPIKILKYRNFYYKISQQFKDFHFSFRIIVIQINSHLHHLHYI